MVIVIVSSLVATIVGVVALVRKPMVPELPEFQEPNFGPDQQFGSSSWHNNEDRAPCQEYPISTQEESYPMESLQNPQGTSHQGAPSQESGIYPALSFEPQTVFPPVTVMTQRMWTLWRHHQTIVRLAFYVSCVILTSMA